MKTVVRLIVFQGLLLSFLVTSSTSQAELVDFFYDKRTLSPYLTEKNGNIAAFCEAALKGVNPRRVIRSDAVRGLYFYLRDNLGYKEQKFPLVDGDGPVANDESRHGFSYGKIDIRFIAQNVYVNTKSHYALYLEHAAFKDIENLQALASRQQETLAAAAELEKELIRRSLVLLGNDLQLMRFAYFAGMNAAHIDDVKLPDLLKFYSRKEFTDFAQVITRGAREIFGNNENYSRVIMLLSRILTYGQINVDQGIIGQYKQASLPPKPFIRKKPFRN